MESRAEAQSRRGVEDAKAWVRPYCITVDSDTISADTVTIRDRDTLEQIRVPVKEIVDHVQSKIKSR